MMQGDAVVCMRHRNRPGGGTGGMGVHIFVCIAQRENAKKTQMVAEGHRCMMTDILGMLGALMVVDRCVGVDGAQ